MLVKVHGYALSQCAKIVFFSIREGLIFKKLVFFSGHKKKPSGLRRWVSVSNNVKREG